MKYDEKLSQAVDTRIAARPIQPMRRGDFMEHLLQGMRIPGERIFSEASRRASSTPLNVIFA
jgi:hypothetical protein